MIHQNLIQLELFFQQFTFQEWSYVHRQISIIIIKVNIPISFNVEKIHKCNMFSCSTVTTNLIAENVRYPTRRQRVETIVIHMYFTGIEYYVYGVYCLWRNILFYLHPKGSFLKNLKVLDFSHLCHQKFRSRENVFVQDTLSGLKEVSSFISNVAKYYI